MRTVAIIGGGVCGLISIKCCLEAGLSPMCFEMTNDIGGLWNYDGNAIDGKASVMKSTVINTSKEFMAFSDFPAPSDYPNYMHNRKLLEYFRMYADHFHLKDHIRFQRRVTRIEPASDYDQTGCWLVSTVDAANKGSASDATEITEKFDAVMLATGHHAYPRWVKFPGFEQFKGQTYHSWQYKTSQGFEDKNVLIIGLGNSAGDMVVELSRVAKQVYVSTRRGSWVLNRVGPSGWPADMALVSEVTAALQRYLPDLYNWIMEKDLNRRFNHELYGLKPKHRAIEQHPFLNDDLPNRIICGSTIVKPNVKEFTGDGRGVIFEDDSRIDQIDCVIFATGFNISFPYLDENIISVQDNQVRLYKFVWPANLKHSTLAVMGLIQPWGAINPLTELQARWVVRVFKGQSKLPSSKVMNDEIDQTIVSIKKRFINSPRHTIEVDHVDYCNALAEEIGCRPNILHYLMTDFPLGQSLLFGPCTPYRYRLNGPNRWDGARQAILTQNERVTCGLHPGPPKQNTNFIYEIAKWIVLAIFIFLISKYLF